MCRALLWEQRVPGSELVWQQTMTLGESSNESCWLTAEKGSPSPTSSVNPALVARSETGCPNRCLKWESQKSTSSVDHTGLWHEIGPETFSASSRILGWWGVRKPLPGLGSSWMRLWGWTSVSKGIGKHQRTLLDLILCLMLQENLTTRSNNAFARLPLFYVVSTLIKWQISWLTPSTFN